MGFTRQISKRSAERATVASASAVDASIVAFASVRNKAATSDPSFGDWKDTEEQQATNRTFEHDVVPAMIEVSRGSPNKYEIEKETGQLQLDRVLHSAVFYPGDYGYIPQTLCGDGDPLDILLISTVDTSGAQKLAPGIVVNCRVLGLMDMEDESGRDEKLIAVIANQKSTDHLISLEDVPAHLKKEIQHFFENYKLLEMKKGKPKWAKVLGWGDKKTAWEVVEASRKSYVEEYGLGDSFHPFVSVARCPNMLHVKQTQVQSSGIFTCYVNVSKGDMSSYLYRQDTSYRHYKYSLDMPYPGDYGWMCQTWQKGCNKPVEVLIMSNFAVEAEALVDVRIIGGLRREFTKADGVITTDLKIICVQKADPRTVEMEDISNLNPQALKHIRNIFQHSAEASGVQECKIVGQMSAAEAIQAAQMAHLEYLEAFSDTKIHNAPNLWCLPWLKESSQGPLNQRVFPAVVEAPKHCSNRYSFDPESGVLKCDGPMNTATFYPANAGFIPQTVAEDGTPVDVMILSTTPLQSRCGVEIRIVGAAECIDEMGPDIKIIGVPKSEPRMKEWDSIEAVPRHMKDEMVHFFNACKDLDDDWKFCRFERWLDSDDAVKYVQSAHSRFFLFALPMQRIEKRIEELERQNAALQGQLGVGEKSPKQKLVAQRRASRLEVQLPKK